MSGVYECKLTLEVKKYTEEYLHETEENRRYAFAYIKKWAEENSNLHIRLEEIHILAFLRGCKFNLEKTKSKLENYYILRRNKKEWFTNRNPHLQQIQDLVKMGCFLPLKHLYENQLVIFIRPAIHDPKIYSLDSLLKTALMILDIAVQEEELSQIYGVIAIIDMKNMSFGHVKQLTVSIIRHLVYAWQNYHCKPKRMDFINAPTYINVVLKTFKAFMTDKMKKRVHVNYDATSSLLKILNEEVIPTDYGGNSDSLEDLGNYWLQKLISYADWFKEDEKYKADQD